MKCPECKIEFSSEKNTEEVREKTLITCPECGTRFETQVMQKMFTKGILIMVVATVLLNFLPPLVSWPIWIIVLVLVLRWVSKPENIVVGNEKST